MGVTVHFFAYDTNHIEAQPTIDHWVDRGWLTDSLEVAPQAASFIKEIESHLGQNRRWYDTIDAQDVWTLVRGSLDVPRRERYDDWFSHTFWSSDEHEPCWQSFAEHERVYSPQDIARLIQRFDGTSAVVEMIDHLINTDPVYGHQMNQTWAKRWLYEPDGFDAHVLTWLGLFKKVQRQGSRWGLLMWIWM